MSEIKTVFIGDIAFNTDITPTNTLTSVGGAAYYSAVGAIAAHKVSYKEPTIGIVAPVGNDFDIRYLTTKGIDTSGSPIIKGEKTCRFILTQHADNTRDFTAERNVAEKLDICIFPRKYLFAKFIHLATSLPQNYISWINFLSEKTEAVISTDAFEVFATQFPDETISALNMSNMIFINEAEANILAKYGSLRTDVPWVLKRGPGGASYIYNGEEINVRAENVVAVETTGAGDVLAGAFLTLMSSGYETEHALRIAVKISSLSVTQFGVEHLVV